jgi:hypothetical protein
VKAISFIFGGLLPIFIWLAGIAAWVTHVLVCIKTASWILLLFGCIVFPVGIIHGIGVWLGIF